jgi:hypothetical protein
MRRVHRREVLATRESVNRDRIIVERLHGHWPAWFDGLPQGAIAGETPAEAGSAERLPHGQPEVMAGA